MRARLSLLAHVRGGNGSSRESAAGRSAGRPSSPAGCRPRGSSRRCARGPAGGSRHGSGSVQQGDHRRLQERRKEQRLEGRRPAICRFGLCRGSKSPTRGPDSMPKTSEGARHRPGRRHESLCAELRRSGEVMRAGGGPRPRLAGAWRDMGGYASRGHSQAGRSLIVGRVRTFSPSAAIPL
jgi:hypothetical protein